MKKILAILAMLGALGLAAPVMAQDKAAPAPAAGCPCRSRTGRSSCRGTG